MQIYKYTNYDEYVQAQIKANQRKFHKRWVRKDDIETLAAELMSRIESIERGMCHGTRAGHEQMWFEEYIPGCVVYGTEISKLAKKHYHTRIWDFNIDRKRWHGRFDFVYSNSWDHAYHFPTTLGIWLKSLRPNGVLILETSDHHAGQVTKVDPFRATVGELTKYIRRWTNGEWYVTKKIPARTENIIDNASVKKGIQSTFLIIIRKTEAINETGEGCEIETMGRDNQEI